MPTYKVRDAETGKTVTFNWAGEVPPTEADIAEVFRASKSPVKQVIDKFGLPGPKGDRVQKVEDWLPALGGTLGAVGGSRFGQTMAGAAGGSAIGSLARKGVYSLQGKEAPQTDWFAETVSNAVLGPVGVGAGKVVNPTLSLSDDAASAVKFADERGLPIKLSELKPSWITTFMDELSGAFFGGRYKTLKYADDANKFLLDARSEALETLTGVKGTKGVPINAIPAKVRPGLRQDTTEAYEAALKMVDGKAAVAPHNMRKVAGELLKDAAVQNAKKGRGAKLPPSEFLRQFLDASDKGIPFADLHKIQAQINRSLYGAGQGASERMMQAFADDLVAWDAGLGTKLNELYTVARAKSKNEHLFDDVYGILRAATTVSKENGAEILDGAKLLAKLQTPMKGSATLTPAKKIIDSAGKEAGEKVIADLTDLANYANYTRKLRAETGSVLNPTTAITGSAGAYADPITGVLIPQGSSVALTMMLTGPGKKGAIRKYLLGGIRPQLRLGTQAVVQRAGDMLYDPTQGGAIPLRTE